MNSDEEDLLLAAAACVILATYKPRRPRRFWVRPSLQSRRIYGGAELLKDLNLDDADPLQMEYRSYFQGYLRLNLADFTTLVSMLAPRVAKADTRLRKAIPAQERVAVALRFLATGDNFGSLSSVFKISKSSISYIVNDVCRAIIHELKEYVKLPSTEEEWLTVAEEYANKWNVPNCVGAMDGKHITIQAPVHSGSEFFNYKKFFSIVLFAVVDADYNFLYANVGCQGRISDGGVFHQTSFKKMLDDCKLNLPAAHALPGCTQAIPYVFLGDDAFPLTPNIMKPYSGQHEKGSSKRICNYRFSRGRRVSENVFGILSNVFRCFRKPMQLKPETAELITFAAVHLHNFMRRNSSKSSYSPAGTFDHVIQGSGQVVDGNWREGHSTCLLDLPRVSRKSSSSALEVREEFRKYFSSPEGEVSWQLDYC